MTSHDVVARVRRILKTKRVGHTGTLDPFATGVLVLLVGKATRLAQFVDKDEKEYEAVLHFGFETDTGDRTGTPTVESGLSNTAIAARLGGLDWNEVLSKFCGKIEQVPPMYSAKKVAGKRLYELARAGKEIDRKPVKIEIKQLEIIKDGQVSDTSSQLRLRVVCTSGTYIRTLAEDIGRHIGIGAHLTELRRTRAGRFRLDKGVTLDELVRLDDPSSKLLPLEVAVMHLSKFTVSKDRVEKTLNGLATRMFTDQLTENEYVRMVNTDQKLIAIGVFDKENLHVKPAIVLA